MTHLHLKILFRNVLNMKIYVMQQFTFISLQGDVGVPGFKGEAGPKGEQVSYY